MRRSVVLLIAEILLVGAPLAAQQGVTRYVRYGYRGSTAYGVLDGELIRELSGDLFQAARPTGRTVPLKDAKLLAPVAPSKVIAVGLNYRSHLGERPVPQYPGLFAKLPTSIVGPDDEIVMPADATDLHYEGEMVIVIGRTAHNVPEASALDYVFGVTAGNDVSERAWQRNDLQWFRAKVSERTSDLIFNVPAIVSYVSRYVTLLPGDLIFTGTPQSTRAMRLGDVVEVEVEGVGVLRNTVVAAKP